MDLLQMVRDAILTGSDGVIVGDIVALHIHGNSLIIETDIELVDVDGGDPDGGEELTPPDFDTEALTGGGQVVGTGTGPQLVVAGGIEGN